MHGLRLDNTLSLAATLLLFLCPRALSSAPGDDTFSVSIPSDAVSIHRILTEEGATYADLAQSFDEAMLERIKKRLADWSPVAADDFEASSQRQSYRMDEARSGSYQSVNDTLKHIGLDYKYDKLLLCMATAPDSVHGKTVDGAPLPLWWVSLDSLEALIHPSSNLISSVLAGGPSPFFPQLLDRTLARWGELSTSQQQQLIAIAKRNDYSAILNKTIRHRANLQLTLIEADFSRFEQDLGLKANQAGSADDRLVILGVLQEEVAPLHYSVRTSQFPEGRWIPERKSTAGILPLSASPDEQRASALYLQTRWSLKIGARMASAETNSAELERYIRSRCFGFIADRVVPPITMTAFVAEFQNARNALQEIMLLSAALQENKADEHALDQMLANPYFDSVVSAEVLHLFTSAEAFRQNVLLRAAR